LKIMVLALLTACAGSQAKPAPQPPPPPARSEAVVTIERIADTVCACPDAACLYKAMPELQAAGDRYRDYHPTEAEIEKLKAGSERITVCAQKLVARERAGRAVRTVQAARDTVCACPDAACIEQAMKDLAATDDNAHSEYSAEDARAIAEATQAMVDCAQRIGAPPAPLSN
jgi:hypothetical protein